MKIWVFRPEILIWPNLLQTMLWLNSECILCSCCCDVQVSCRGFAVVENFRSRAANCKAECRGGGRCYQELLRQTCDIRSTVPCWIRAQTFISFHGNPSWEGSDASAKTAEQGLLKIPVALCTPTSAGACSPHDGSTGRRAAGFLDGRCTSEDSIISLETHRWGRALHDGCSAPVWGFLQDAGPVLVLGRISALLLELLDVREKKEG